MVCLLKIWSSFLWSHNKGSGQCLLCTYRLYIKFLFKCTTSQQQRSTHKSSPCIFVKSVANHWHAPVFFSECLHAWDKCLSVHCCYWFYKKEKSRKKIWKHSPQLFVTFKDLEKKIHKLLCMSQWANTLVRHFLLVWTFYVKALKDLTKNKNRRVNSM